MTDGVMTATITYTVLSAMCGFVESNHPLLLLLCRRRRLGSHTVGWIHTKQLARCVSVVPILLTNFLL